MPIYITIDKSFVQSFVLVRHAAPILLTICVSVSTSARLSSHEPLVPTGGKIALESQAPSEGMGNPVKPDGKPHIVSFGGKDSHLLLIDLKVRATGGKRYKDSAENCLRAVADVARLFLSKDGGPILLQLENEYGSDGRQDPDYLPWLRAFREKQGIGPFNTTDGPGARFLAWKNIVLDGVTLGLDPREHDGHFNEGRPFVRAAPLFCGELHPGWVRHWGENDWAPVDNSSIQDPIIHDSTTIQRSLARHGGRRYLWVGANTSTFRRTFAISVSCLLESTPSTATRFSTSCHSNQSFN